MSCAAHRALWRSRIAEWRMANWTDWKIAWSDALMDEVEACHRDDAREDAERDARASAGASADACVE